MMAPRRILGTVLLVAALALPLAWLSGVTAETIVNIEVMDNRFSPQNLSVSAGSTVVWTNNGNLPHTTTSDTGVWDSGALLRGQTFSRTFDTPGAYAYNCVFHRGAGMAGTITVRPVVSALPAYQASPSFTVSWSGSGSIASYDIQFKDGASGSWTDWITSTTALASTFTGGQDAHTYYFQSRARYSGGNVVAYPGGNGDTNTTVDLTAPTGSLSINYGAAYVSQAGVTLQPSASDATSGVAQMQFSNDGSSWTDWQSYATTKAWTLTSGDGSKTVYARFKDTAGNISAPFTATVILDTTLPSGSLVINQGATFATAISVTLTLSTTGSSQMQFSNDGSNWSSWEGYGTSKTWSLSSGDGNKTVYARFRDSAGNISAAYTDTIILDIIAPASSVSALPPYANTVSGTVAWSGSDALSGLSSYDVQYRDGPSGTWTDLLSNTTITSTTFSGQDGHTYYFQSRARDTAGNVDAYPGGNGDTSTTVDLSPPTGSVSINGGALYATSISATLNLSATDAASGAGQMAFSNDGTAWSNWETYAASRVWTLTAGDGLKTAYARFRDNAGNASAAYSDTITLLSTASSAAVVINGGDLYTRVPTATLALSSPDLAYTSQMRFSEDGLSYSSFEPFTTTHPYTLTAGDGLKAVWAQYKSDADVVTGPYSDTIVLDTAPPTATVGSLATYQTSASFPVAWSATDATSGPAAYDLQYRDRPTGNWTDWLSATAMASLVLLNGGFENGGSAPDYWQSSGGSIARVSSNIRSGAYSARLTSTSLTTKWIYQTVAVTGGNPYTLSGYVLKNDAQVASVYLRIVFYSSIDGTGPSLSDVSSNKITSDSSQFQLLTVGPVIAPTLARSARVMGVLQPLSTAESSVFFDDFSLETATAALSSTFTGQDGRTYYFRARAADNAGNQGDYPGEAQAQTTVDTTPPTGSLSTPAYASSTAITLTLAATDTFGVAGMAFGSDGSTWGSWEPYTTTRSFDLASGDGQKTVYGKFRDNAGNYSSPYSATVVLDTTPPGQAFPDDGVSGTSRNPTPTFSWAPVTDNLSGVAGYSWRVDSGTETYTTTTTVILPSQADGEHTFYVRALDRAGNYGSYGSHLFTINTAAPAPPDILQPQSPTAADKIIVSGAAPPVSTVKLYVNGAYFAQATAGAYGIWNMVNVPIIMGENVLKATATDAYGLTSALSSPMVVMRVPVYYAPPADMASGVVAPSAGGTVTTTNNYMVIVPQGAITQSVKVVLTPLAPQSAPTVFGIAGTDSYVALSAVTSDTGEKVSSFQEPVTVTLSYDPAKLTAPESSLTIHYYDEALGRWVALPSLVDTVSHTVSAQTTHFTVFGILANLPWRGYLPLVLKSYASGW